MTIQFVLFLIAQAVSDFGSAASAAGIAVIWASQGAPAAELAIMLATPAVPALILGPILGSLMEGARLKRALITINVLLGLTSLAAIAALPLPKSQALLVLTGIFVLKALGQGAFNGAYNRAFRLLAPEGGMSGRAQATQTFSNRIGTAIGAAVGAVVALNAGGTVFLVDAITFGVAALIVTRLPLGTGAPALAPAEAEQANQPTRRFGFGTQAQAIARNIAVAVRYVTGNPRLVRVFALYAPLTLCWAVWDILGAYLFNGVGAGTSFWMIVLAYQLGEIAAAAWLWVKKPKFNVAIVMTAAPLLSIATLGSGFVVMSHDQLGLVGMMVLAVVLRLVTGATANIGGGGVYAILVYAAPDNLTSRLSSLVESVGLGAMFGLAKLGVGLLNDAAGTQVTFVVAGVVATAMALAVAVLEVPAYLADRRTVRRLRMQAYLSLCESGSVIVAQRYYMTYINGK